MGGTPGYLRFIHTVDEWASGAERLGTHASARPHALVCRIDTVVVGGNEQCGVAETQISQARAFKFWA